MFARRGRLPRPDFALGGFFGASALGSIVILVLITVFLFREGAGFFGHSHGGLRAYRLSGQEFVDLLRAELDEHSGLNRQLGEVRSLSQVHLESVRGVSREGAVEALAELGAYRAEYLRGIGPLRALVTDLSAVAMRLRTEQSVGKAAGIEGDPVAARARLEPILGRIDEIRAVERVRAEGLRALLEREVSVSGLEAQGAWERFQKGLRRHWERVEATDHAMLRWDPSVPVRVGAAVGAFFFGERWVTNSSWQDWYGLLPLLTGSLMISALALGLALPMGVGAAIYVSQLAGEGERRWIKPSIEFIQAIPSVVLGFFGIVVLGDQLRRLSEIPWLTWVPGWPMQERLNAFTAGCLLALMAIPTVFTLAEDALNNVPRAYREASYALGATRLQTIFRVVVPTALSGIMAAALLGFGRVIGETMVVLLVAGNRIQIPDFFGSGAGAFFQPVHTMTGIVAQELGEVENGSTHYRALFIVGLTLFFLSLTINYLAQKIVERYRLKVA